MYFCRIHPVEETGEIIENCFYDSDGVVRLPVGRPTDDEVVTHWAEMPSLPGTDVQRLFGDDVGTALRVLFDRELSREGRCSDLPGQAR